MPPLSYPLTLEEIRELGLPEDYPGRRRVDTTLNVEDLMHRYAEKQRIWACSDERSRTIDVLQNCKPAEGWNITEAICLGTGSFSEVWFNGHDGSGRSLLQLAAFQDIVACLQKDCAAAIKVLIQDPSYNVLDRGFVSALGLTLTMSNDGYRNGHDANGEGRDALESIRPTSFLCELMIEQNHELMRKISEFTPQLILGSSWPSTMIGDSEEEVAWHEQQLKEDAAYEASCHGQAQFYALQAEWRGKYVGEELAGFGEPGNVLGTLRVLTRSA
ncbi:hypothetical protein LTR27_002182 [Elasticomyces elasticus]|nr:hypothetical protein LTR27_002182 [Elasticomyces elasticus]